MLQLLSVVIGLSQNRDVFQREVDSINKMPLRIAYLIPIDSLGRCVNEEFLDSENMYHYALVGEINIIKARRRIYYNIRFSKN